MTIHGVPSKLKVLLVPDHLQWVTGTIAKQIALQNENWVEATICSLPMLEEMLDEFGDIGDKVDLVHFLTISDSDELFARYAGKFPCVATFHHIEPKDSFHQASAADAVMTSSSLYMRELVARGVPAEKLVKVPYGVDIEMFRPPVEGERIRLREELGLPPSAFVIGFVAKRSSDSSGRKGLDTLLGAIASVRRKKLDAAILIVGPGWSDVANQAIANSIPCVHIPFIHDSREFAKIYRCLDTYWITSRIEGGPVPLLEAMSSGVPCITTPVGHAPDIVRDGENGFIVPFNDADAYIRHTERLIQDPGLRIRLGQAAHATIVDGYQWSQVARNAWPLYSTAVERYRQRPDYSRTIILPQPSWPETQPAHPVDQPKLAAFPQRTHRYIIACEDWYFMEVLARMGETREAARMRRKALLSRPFDPRIWKHFLLFWLRSRPYLNPWVSKAVKLKNRLRSIAVRGKW